MILSAVAIGGGIGYLVAQRIEMTAMPQLVAAFHSLVGLAAVFVAVGRLPVARPISTSRRRTATSTTFRRLEMGLGIIIGAITFSGSVIAFGKLQAKLPPGWRARSGH